eukprot:TRINITY_DN3133_c0_g1_i1.p1 TRINITY_DN3133_c0_g1~~TRINITY_DN3133_c0_g1_i1.p1  ORF type:complete len:445 (+),score=82.14 TRINITY_DN3133_c0_g1_i1:473-1807(+)
MPFTAICVALATCFVAHAVKVPFSVRQTVAEDAIGTFNVSQFLGGSCPFQITHDETAGEDGTIPHSVMAIGPNRCTDGGALQIVTPEDARGLVAADSSRNLIELFTSAGLSALFGVENSPRRCGGRMFPVGTLVIIFQPVESIVIGLDQYFPARRYMIVDDPSEPGICRYSAFRRTVEATPTPEESPEEEVTEPGTGAAVTTATPAPPAEEPTGTDEGTDGGTDEGTTTGGLPISGEQGGPEGDITNIEPPETPEEPTETPEDDDPVCFPADGTVLLEDGSVKRMDEVEIGDSVMVGEKQFSEVFMFSHRLASVKHRFVRMELANGLSIEATTGHYVYVNGRLLAASSVKVGDRMELVSGDRVAVSRVSVVKKSGLFNPQTLHGDIIVNGVRASTFTQAVQVCTASALMAPLRFAYALFGWSASFLNGGMESVANMLPDGAAAL